jgi:hypothetical protein
VELTRVDRAGLVVVVPAQAIQMATKASLDKATRVVTQSLSLRQAAAAGREQLVSVVMTP